MITFNKLGLQGRLGNQMFQYALIYAVAKHLNVPVGVPFSNKSADEREHFSLPDGFEITAVNSSDHTFLHEFSEKQSAYDPSVFEVEDNTNFFGHFESEKFFVKYKEEIKQEFNFKPRILKKAKNLLADYSGPLVSICVRRGDYIKTPELPMCQESYYRECLLQFPNHRKLVFTDAPEWSQRLPDVEIVSQTNDPDNKFVVLKAMSMCDHHIISNSTFAWWGAWLGHNKDKKVLAPSAWFSPEWAKLWQPNSHWQDIYCKNWIVIENRRLRHML